RIRTDHGTLVSSTVARRRHPSRLAGRGSNGSPVEPEIGRDFRCRLDRPAARMLERSGPITPLCRVGPMLCGHTARRAVIPAMVSGALIAVVRAANERVEPLCAELGPVAKPARLVAIAGSLRLAALHADSGGGRGISPWFGAGPPGICTPSHRFPC